MLGSLGAVMGRYLSSDGSTFVGGVINNNRKCRDVGFLALFIAFWIAIIVNSSFGFSRGNPLRLSYGQDYKGNTCGDKHGHPNLRQLDLTYMLNPNQVYLSGLKESHVKLTDVRSICLLDCPTPSEDGVNWVCDYPEGDIRLKMDDWIDRNYDYYEFLTPEMRNTSLQLQGPCYPVIFPSVNVYWRCQFIARPSNSSMRHWLQMGGLNINDDILIEESIYKSVNSRSSVIKRYIGDTRKAWPVLIVCGALLPLFLSVIWLLMIRHFVSAMPWITIVLFNSLIISVTLLIYIKAGWIGNGAITPFIGSHDRFYKISGREVYHLRAVAVLLTCVAIIAILTSIAIARRVLMAASVLKVAAKVIDEVQALIIFPVIPFFALAIFYMLWISSAFNLLSSGKIVQNTCNASCCAYDLLQKKIICEKCCGYDFHYTPHIAISIFFHLFGWYWVTQFFLACSSTIIAGSAASYYWNRGETSAEPLFVPVLSSMKRLIRYSIGSLALGSLITSFVESIRFIFESLRRKLKSHEIEPHSWLGRTLNSTSKTCLISIDWILKSVNRNAYIMIAIKGKNFCRASSIATDLIMNNITRIGSVNVIGDMILVLGKFCVSLFSALFAFLILDTQRYKSSQHKITSPLFPVLVCWIFGYVVASLFFGVVETSIDTMILSYCQDSDDHHGSAQYAPPLLMETLNNPNEQISG